MTISDHRFYFPGGPTGVLLIHGLTGTPVEMRYVGRGLAQAGYSVYGMQLPGHCGSEADLLRTRWPDWYKGVEEAVAEFRPKVERLFIGGLSMGAVLGLHLAALRPETVDGLLLYSTTLWYDGWSIPRSRVMLPLLPIVLRLPYGRRYRFREAFPYGIKDERLRARVLANMMNGLSGEAGLPSTPGPSLQQLRRLVAVVKRELPRVKAPSLVIHARHDDVTSISNAHYLERHLGGPVEVALLDDCYHMITVDRERAEVVRRSDLFLRAQAVARGGESAATGQATESGSC